jgi:putative membrane protein
MTSLAVAMGDHAFGAGFGFLFLLIPLFWLGAFALVFALVGRRFRRGGWAGHPGHAPWAQGARRAEFTLAERFAQGDIDEKEYRARLEVLRANNLPEQPGR